MLKRTKGDLIELAERGDFDIIVHGANCQNVMGSGIAKLLRNRYPEVFNADTEYTTVTYPDTQHFPILKLGNFSVACALSHKDHGKRFMVINAYTQVHYLPRGIDHFEYESFNLILRKLGILYPRAKFGFPMIGMGLAGGDPSRIIPMLQQFADRITQTGGSATLVEFDN